MKNKFLTLAFVPYIPALTPHLGGSPLAAILLQKLDFWNDRSGPGFYKFILPAPSHAMYKPGDSWKEELEYSDDVFRTAFDKIGVRHPSRKAYEAARDAGTQFDSPTGPKYYCSYHDRGTGLTHYFRNDAILDAMLDRLCADGGGSFTEAPPAAATEPEPTPKPARARGTALPVVPPELDSPEFNRAWGEFVAHRAEIKHPLKPSSAAKLLKKCAAWGPARAVAAIEHSIAGGYQGIFEDRGRSNHDASGQRQRGTDLERRDNANVQAELPLIAC
jgi:hypothetical protein